MWTNETSAHRRINEPNKMLNLRGFFNQLSNKEIILYKQKLTAFQKISGSYTLSAISGFIVSAV